MTHTFAARRALFGGATALATICVIAVAPAASAASGDLVLSSTSDTGVKGNGISNEPSLSADGTTVAFHSFATNLDPADTDLERDVYIKDLVTGDVVLASTSTTGVKGNGSSYAPSLSADGTTVAFSSLASNLDPADTDTDADVYVKNLVSGAIVLASTSTTGVKGNDYSYQPFLSGDGTTVALSSFATNLDPADTDSALDVYVKDLVTGDVVLASTSTTGVKGNNWSSEPSLSADGTTVAFHSEATNLDPADTDLFFDVYVKNLTTGDIVLASTSTTGVKSDRSSYAPSLTADGTTVAFSSYAYNLDPADTDFESDVYVKNLTTGDIVLASTSTTGVKSNGDSSNPSLTADGTTVAFSSFATNLDPADTDSVPDMYVKDLVTGDVVLASTSTTGVKGNGPSVEPSLSGDGTTVAFTSAATNLDPADTESENDVYVKHVAGPVTPVTMTIRNRSLEEGDAGFTKFKFRVELSAASAGTVTVDYATGDLTATAGTDYEDRSGTLTFAPGTTRRNVVMRVFGDTVAEPLERFSVTLSNASGATITDGDAIGRILNDDA